MLWRAVLHLLFRILRLWGFNPLSVLPHAPELTDPRLIVLIERVVPDGRAIFLAVTPARFAKVKGCFPAVVEKVRRDGGAMVVGWQIWQTQMLLEAGLLDARIAPPK